MKRLGFIVSDLGPSQFSYYLINGANALLKQRQDVDITAFIENVVPPCLPTDFAVMQSAEAYGFTGTVVANSFLTAQKLLACPFPAKKLFYCFDLDWVRMKNKDFFELRFVYANPELTMIARGEDHKDMLESIWNRRVEHIIDDCDIAKLLEIS